MILIIYVIHLSMLYARDCGNLLFLSLRGGGVGGYGALLLEPGVKILKLDISHESWINHYM
jgi:hypothetical protein